MKLLRKLIPDFLRQWDLELQRSHPRLWSTRIHHHLWFLLLINALVFALGLLIRVTTVKFPDPEDLFGWIMTPTVVYAAFWVYKVVLFTPERRFGIRKPFAEVGELGVHFISLLLIMTIPYNLALTVTYRIANLMTDAEFAEDVDTLNKNAYLFISGDGRLFSAPSNSYDEDAQPYLTSSSSHGYFKDLDEYVDRNRYVEDGPPKVGQIYEDHITAYNEMADPDLESYDPVRAAFHRVQIDSIERTCPFYFTAHGPFTPQAWGGIFLSDSLLEVGYVDLVRSGRPVDPEAVRRTIELGHVYSAYVTDRSVDDVLREFTQRRSSSFNLDTADQQIRNMWEAKTWNYDFLEWDTLIYVLFISCFLLAIVISIFKNLYWQPLLITAVVCLLLPITLLVFALILDEAVRNVNEEDILINTYYAIALFLAAWVFLAPRTSTYGTVRAVLAILANLIVPFIVFFTLTLLHIEWVIFGLDALQDSLYVLRDTAAFNDPALAALEMEVHDLEQRVQMILTVVFWANIALYVIALHSFFRATYTRMMALPERK